MVHNILRATQDVSKRLFGFPSELVNISSKNTNESKCYESGLSLEHLVLQLAHDIRSPLAALAVAEKDFAALPEESRILLRSAVTRIKDIVNNVVQLKMDDVKKTVFLSQKCFSQEELEIHLLSTSIEEVLVEKRTQLLHSKVQIEIQFVSEEKTSKLVGRVQLNEFKTIISNLLNNAVESIVDSGTIRIVLSGDEHFILLLVEDTGKGITEEVLRKLGSRGETHNKVGGGGLGLYHAFRTLRYWGGEINIDSKVGEGTRVYIRFPRIRDPKWL